MTWPLMSATLRSLSCLTSTPSCRQAAARLEQLGTCQGLASETRLSGDSRPFTRWAVSTPGAPCCDMVAHGRRVGAWPHPGRERGVEELASYAVVAFSLSGSSETRKVRSVCCWLVHPRCFVQVAVFWMCGICTMLCAFFLLFWAFVHFDWARIPTLSLHVCCRSGTHGGAFPPARSPARPGCSHRAADKLQLASSSWALARA